MNPDALRNVADSPMKRATPASPFRSGELVVGIVGHIGSGTSTVANQLSEHFSTSKRGLDSWFPFTLKASEVIKNASDLSDNPPDPVKLYQRVTDLQNAGDELRNQKGEEAVALGLIQKIREYRAESLGVSLEEEDPVEVDGKPRVYILDSLRHPAEVNLLRRVYGDAFILVGVVCDEAIRKIRLAKGKFKGAQENEVDDAMERDAKDKIKWGQQVANTFHLSDYFVDNTASRFSEEEGKDKKDAGSKTGGVDPDKNQESNVNWAVGDELKRIVSIVLHNDIIRPTVAEAAMYAAHGAARISSCLSRQVGASIVDSKGNIVSTGTNEVPKAGGGAYGTGSLPPVPYSPEGDVPAASKDSDKVEDGRCFLFNKFCSNNKEQREMAEKLVKSISKDLNEHIRMDAKKLAEDEDILELVGNPNNAKRLATYLQNSLKIDPKSIPENTIKESFLEGPIGSLLEFSRAVHAEMNALIEAGRKGVSTVGTRLFVTTYPCHYCARHIVSAGVDEVQFIEPYFKSKAIDLHDDSIQKEGGHDGSWLPPSKGGHRVLFRPFTGVAPRMFLRAFSKDRDYKSQTGGFKISSEDIGSAYEISMRNYLELERELSRKAT